MMKNDSLAFFELSDEECEMLQCTCESFVNDRPSNMPPPKPFVRKSSGSPRNAIMMSIHRHGRALVAEQNIFCDMHHRDLATHILSIPAPFYYRSVHNRMIGLEISTSEPNTSGEDKTKLFKIIADFDQLLGSI